MSERSEQMARLTHRYCQAVLICAGCILIYIEYVTYILQAWSWPTLNCPENSKCTSLLFVADPQILGERDEPFFITRWDNDRYLRRTYDMAVRHSSPDGVIFLGDLMDEGSRSNDWEFQRYTSRFFSIFPTFENVPAMYIPGDNDIGGEDGEPILPDVVYRFRRTFNKSSELLVGSCRIVKVNPVVETMPPVDPAQVAADQHIRIVVSHFPLIGLSSPFSDKMVQQLQPHIVFSAHTHSSRLRRGMMASNAPLVSLLPISIRRGDQNRATGDEEGWTSASDAIEIVVPTCSYRMGVKFMGYGYALIDSSRRELWYVVLWLPSRFFQLIVHLCVLISFLGIMLCFKGCGSKRQTYSKLQNKSHA